MHHGGCHHLPVKCDLPGIPTVVQYQRPRQPRILYYAGGISAPVVCVLSGAKGGDELPAFMDPGHDFRAAAAGQQYPPSARWRLQRHLVFQLVLPAAPGVDRRHVSAVAQ